MFKLKKFNNEIHHQDNHIDLCKNKSIYQLKLSQIQLIILITVFLTFF